MSKGDLRSKYGLNYVILSLSKGDLRSKNGFNENKIEDTGINRHRDSHGCNTSLEGLESVIVSPKSQLQCSPYG